MSENMMLDKRADQYVRLRDKINDIKAKHKAELAPFTDMLEKLGNVLLQELDKVGGKSVRTAGGTISTTLDRQASIADKDAFWTYVVTQGLWDLIDYKANAPAVADYIEQHQCQPPGVNFTQRYKISVRRPTKSAD